MAPIGFDHGDEPMRKAVRRLRGSLLLVALFSGFVNILMLTGPVFMMQVYDRVLSSGSVATLQGLLAIVVALYMFMAAYDFFRTRLLSRAAYKLDAEVGAPALRRWIASGLTSSSKASRPIHDLSVVRSFLGSPAMSALFDVPWVPFYLVIVFIIHPWLGFLALGGVAVITVLALTNQAVTTTPLKKALAMDAAESFFVEQSRRSAEALLPLGMGNAIERRWRKLHDAGLATSQTGGDRSEGFVAASKSFRLLLQSALLALGGYLALSQEISAGMIVAASIIAGRALAPVDQVIGQWRNVVRARQALQSLFHTLDQSVSAPQRVELPAPEGRVSLKGVIKYPPSSAPVADAKPILDRVSFELAAGDGLGVIGPSAAGKSSLARIIVGAWGPEAGEVRLDGATLDQWDPERLGPHIGYLPQNLELLAGSVRDNIARFVEDAEDEEVIEAAKLAGVHDMILQLPQGYATEIEFGQSILSGGQVQRIGLARALFRKPALIVLDEPNSNLDAEGDDALSNAIAEMRKLGSTVIVMAHRPSALASVNKALVLREGRVVEFGDKDDVIRKVTKAASEQRSVKLDRAS